MVDKKKYIKVKLVRSLIGRTKKHVQSASALGLKKINKVVELQDTPEVRGLINKISYLIHCEY